MNQSIHTLQTFKITDYVTSLNKTILSSGAEMSAIPKHNSVFLRILDGTHRINPKDLQPRYLPNGRKLPPIYSKSRLERLKAKLQDEGINLIEAGIPDKCKGFPSAVKYAVPQFPKNYVNKYIR